MLEEKNELAKKRELPTLAELIKDVDVAWKKDSFNLLLSQQPPTNWVKKHPFISNYNYLPIDKVEYLLRKIFKQYKIEVIKTGMLLNAIEVIVRVHYLDPITGDWLFHDGTGAQELQTQKDTGNLKLDMSNVNRGAVTMALPIAKTVAIKDACDHFGDLFGANLNRKDTLVFQTDKSLDSDNMYDEIVSLFESKKDLIPSNRFVNIQRIIDDKEKSSYTKILRDLKSF
jgi:hypothetical protein